MKFYLFSISFNGYKIHMNRSLQVKRLTSFSFTRIDDPKCKYSMSRHFVEKESMRETPLASHDVVITVNTAHCVTLEDGLRRLMQKKMEKIKEI